MNSLKWMCVLYSFSSFFPSLLSVTYLLPTHYWCRGFLLHLITLNDTTPSTEILWRSDQPDPCLTPQNTQLCPDEILTHNSSKHAVSDLYLRQRGHWIRCLLYPHIWRSLLYNITRCYMMLSVAKPITGLWYQERRTRLNFEGKAREPNRGTIQTRDWRLK